MGRSNMCNIHTAKKTERTQEEITISGNPAKPQGEDGATMLKRMNESHSPVTCWALEHWQIAPEEELLDIGCGGGEMCIRDRSDCIPGIDTGSIRTDAGGTGTSYRTSGGTIVWSIYRGSRSTSWRR